MGEIVVELALCALIGLLSLVVVAWDVATGLIVYLDGIALAIIALTVGAFFLFNVFWSCRQGELKQAWQEFRKSKGRHAGEPAPPGP